MVQKMNGQSELSSYIKEHIEDAIEKNSIKIYYQPVIRTVTGEMCGKEALVRWDDPVHSMLLPEQIVPVLEEAGLIHKLDIFVIKKVCEHYSHCYERKDPLIPISFNLSLLDFTLCDIISVLNEETEKNRVPRQMIKVEITERLIAHDREFIGAGLRKLREEGYGIIMDDFGNDRSSINIFKSYVFDELKIDMHALWENNEKSKKLIGYLCSMAKAMGIKATAECVESAEQVDFLNYAGCEKMQGNYFCTPMFFWDLIPYCREKGLTVEHPGLKEYYDVIGQVDVMERSNVSYAITEFINGNIRFIYINEKFRKNLSSLEVMDYDSLEGLCNDPEYDINFKFNNMMKRSKERKKEQIIDFVWNGNYCIGKVSHLTGADKREACEVWLMNLSMDSRVNHLQKINDALDSVYSIFDRVVAFDPEKDRITVLYKDTEYTANYEGNSYSINVSAYIKQEIYPDDRERYRQFADFKNLMTRIKGSGRSFISGCFRFRNERGNYVWREQYIIPERMHEEKRKFLICTKEVDEKQLALLMGLSSFIPTGAGEKKNEGEIPEDVLWRNAIESAPVGVFWKDRNRRFLGVNKVFLEYYGFDSEAEVLGKTDEDMNWHIDPVPFKEDEEKILNSGSHIKNVAGKCIARGENRDILVNKAPIIKDGKIVGLIGFFRDITERSAIYEAVKNVSFTDSVTGLLNVRGIMGAIPKFEEAYENNNMDFAMMAFHVHDYREIREEFGREHTGNIMKAVADRIRRSTGNSAVIGRTGSNLFLVIRQVEKKEEGPSLMQSISNDIRSLREVDGKPCTIYTSAGYASYSECESIEALYSATMKRMNDQMERIRRFTGRY